MSDEIPLAPDHQLALEQATRWRDDALRELGEATLRAEEADRLRRRCIAQAQHMTLQHRNILAMICDMLALPPGEWSYDAEKGAMVRRVRPKGQP